MKTVGMMIKCDRCPEEVFVKRISCSASFRVDVIASEKFEDDPRGWIRVSKYTLCPECSKKYNEMWAAFWAKDLVENEGDTQKSMTAEDWILKNGLGGKI